MYLHKAMIMYKITVTLLTAAMFIGCGEHQHHTHDHSSHESEMAHEGHAHELDEHEGEHDHEGEHAAETEHPAGEIVFTKEQAAETDFAIYEVKPVIFNEIIPASGQILSAQGDEATVVAPVSGIVSFSSKKLSEGTAVNRGETLFYISSKEIAEGDYAAKIQATYIQAKAAFERAESLVKEKIISQAEYEQTRLAYENAKAAQEAVAGKTTNQGTGVSATIGGYVTSVAISEGAYVAVGQPLATISQNRRLKLRAEVSQRYHSLLSTITSAKFKTSYDNKIYSLKDLGGRLISIGKASDGTSAYIPITFEFDNRAGIVSGAFVEVFLIASPQANSLIVPISSLIEEQGLYSVFVQIDGDCYRKQEVKLGGNDGEYVEIISGLTPGDKVVSRGAYRVKMASFSGASPHGHQH